MAYYINNLNQKIAYKYIKGKSPGIIFIHGMNSDMQGEKALSIQKYAKKKELSFLRFDCRGHGKSYGKFHDFTISDWKKDLLDMLDHITCGPQILIGSSMGGWLMMLAARARKSRVRGLIGLAPAADFTSYLFTELPKKSQNEIKKNGYSNVKKWNYKYTFTKKLFQDGRKNFVLNKKFLFNKPVILIHGLQDKDVSPQITQKILKKISSKKVQIRYLKNSGHRLSGKNDLKTIHNAVDNILDLN